MTTKGEVMKAGAVGTIRNGDNVLHGRVVRSDSSVFTFRIDGFRNSNVFRPGEWEFTPDVPPLPTAFGSGVVASIDGGSRELFTLEPSYTPSDAKWENEDGDLYRSGDLIAPVVVFDASEVTL